MILGWHSSLSTLTSMCAAATVCPPVQATIQAPTGSVARPNPLGRAGTWTMRRSGLACLLLRGELADVDLLGDEDEAIRQALEQACAAERSAANDLERLVILHSWLQRSRGGTYLSQGIGRI
jgi:hypothetical protein